MTKMRLPKAILFHWVAPIAVLLCGGWFVFTMGAREKPKRKKPPVRKSIPVQVVRAMPHPGQLDITANGVVIPFREVELSSRVGGEVVFKSDSLSPGHTVEAGDLLLRIDDSDYKLEVARLEQEVGRAAVELDRLKIDLQNAERLLKINRDMVDLRKREVDRMDQLRQQNAASAADRDAAELAMLTASQQVTVQENQISRFRYASQDSGNGEGTGGVAIAGGEVESTAHRNHCALYRSSHCQSRRAECHGCARIACRHDRRHIEG